MNEKLRTFKIEVNDIENVDFEHGMLQEIAKSYADAMDLKRYELVLNKNIITIKDKITGINSYMGMKVSLEPLEKDISFIVRPSNQLTYEELQQENKILKEKNEIYKSTIKGQHRRIEELKQAKKASKQIQKERNKILRQENERLKERMEYLERSNNRRDDTIIYLREENIDYEIIVDEAIEYIEENKLNDNKISEMLCGSEIVKLLEILKGEKE